ncbi:hypothetical protein OG507_35225 [Streptomyces sp. NBC_01217]|nr:hypothetical protein OG507_35225 [Streptomyces sp. NBC_01217]
MSWDQGSAATDQRKAARNGFAFLMLSAGTPMMSGGDETLRGLRCNNNPYNLDSAANWLDYSWDTDESTFRTYTQRLLAFRKAHPALRPADFCTASDTNGNGMGRLNWFTPTGAAPDSAYWNNADNHAPAWRIDGTELGDPAGALYVAYNGGSGAVDFTLPSPGSGKQWYRVTDTSVWAEGANPVAQPGSEALTGGSGTTYSLGVLATLVLIAKQATGLRPPRFACGGRGPCAPAHVRSVVLEAGRKGRRAIDSLLADQVNEPAGANSPEPPRARS